MSKAKLFFVICASLAAAVKIVGGYLVFDALARKDGEEESDESVDSEE